MREKKWRREKPKFPLTGIKEGDISRDPADIIKVTAASEVAG